MKHKNAVYFLIAALPVLISSSLPPDSPWMWFKLIVSSLLAGLIALKALYSDVPPTAPVNPPQPPPQ